MYTTFSSAPQAVLCSGKWLANWMNVAWRWVLIGQHFNIHTYISTQDFWGLLKDLTLLQDNTQLEEQLPPFDGAFILWFTVGFILSLSVLHLAHFTHLLLAWSGRNLTLQTSLSSRVHMPLSLFSRSVVSNSLWPHGLQLPDSSVHGIVQARILEWVAIPFSRGSSWPRDQTYLLFGRWILYYWATWEALHMPKLGKILIKTHVHQCKSE